MCSKGFAFTGTYGMISRRFILSFSVRCLRYLARLYSGRVFWALGFGTLLFFSFYNIVLVRSGHIGAIASFIIFSWSHRCFWNCVFRLCWRYPPLAQAFWRLGDCQLAKKLSTNLTCSYLAS